MLAWIYKLRQLEQKKRNMLNATEVKQLAVVIQALKPRRSSDKIGYLEALHRWRHGRVTVIRNLIPMQHRVLFSEECPVPTDPYTSKIPGPKVESKAPVTLHRVAGYDPEEQPFKWTTKDATEIHSET